MRDEQDNGAHDEETPSWVEASGAQLETIGERAPRLHWMLVVLGPLGLAIAILTSLWNSGRHVERSVNVQVETHWVAGEQLAIRTLVVDYDLAPLEDLDAVELRYVDHAGATHELGALVEVSPGMAQGSFVV